MPRYQVTALDARSGSTSLLDIDAATDEAAIKSVTLQGLAALACVKLSPETPAATVRALRWDVAEWARELRTLLRSGMTVVEALDTLMAQAPSGPRAAVLSALLQALRSGRTLSSAMTGTESFPPILIAGVTASEKTSNLVSALDDYLGYHGMLDGLKRKVVSSAVYPSIVAAVGLSVTTFLLIFVIPRFARLYDGQAEGAGTATRMLLWVSELLTTRLPVLALAVALTGAVMWAGWRSGALTRLARGALDALPVFRRLRREFQLARLYQSLTLMVRGGYPLSEALEQCAELERKSSLVPSLVRTQSALLQGKGIATVLHHESLADVTDHRLLLVGERSGNFDEVLLTIAQRHATAFATGIDRVTRLVEPLMLLGVSLLVGGIVVLMYMPVFDIAAGIR